MTRTQVQQIVVILLLLVFGFVWMNTRNSPSPETAVPALPPPREDLHAAPAPPPAPEDPGTGPEEISIGRDLFRLPDRLLQKLQERERALEASLEEPREPEPERAVKVTPEILPPLKLPMLALQGVFWGTDRPQAIINRKILSVGDTIEGAYVSAISKEGVTLSYNGQTVQLQMEADVRPSSGSKDPGNLYGYGRDF